MMNIRRAARGGLLTALILATTACSSTGGLGGVLGDVLGGGSNQISGTIQGVNTRTQQIGVTQSNGQTIALTYDNNTRVVYQNQNYPVTALEWGDRVTARIPGSGSNNYTDLIEVTQSVGNSAGAGTGNVQTYDGRVRSVDRNNGIFTISTNNYGIVSVSMPFNARQTDVTRFNNLRNGDFVRFYGVMVNNTRIDLRQFN